MEVFSLQQQENTKDHQLYFRSRGSLHRWISKNCITSERLLSNLRLTQHQGPDGGPPQRPIGGWPLARPRRLAVSPRITVVTASHRVDLPGQNFAPAPAAAAPPPPPLRAPTAPPRPCLTRPRVRPPALTFIGPHLHAHPPQPAAYPLTCPLHAAQGASPAPQLTGPLLPPRVLCPLASPGRPPGGVCEGGLGRTRFGFHERAVLALVACRRDRQRAAPGGYMTEV